MFRTLGESLLAEESSQSIGAAAQMAPAVSRPGAGSLGSDAEAQTVWELGSGGWSTYSFSDNTVPTLVALCKLAPK